MKIQKILPVTLVATLGCAGLVLVTLQAFHRPATYKKDKIGSSISASASFSDFDFTEYTTFAQKKFTVKGKKLSVENKKFGFLIFAPANAVYIKDAEIVFYEGNRPVSSIWAKIAVLNKPFDRKNMAAAFVERIEFSDSIGMITEDRRTLTCEKLEYDNARGRILASGKCKLRYKGESARADIIDSDVKLQDFNLKKDKGKRFRSLMKMLT